MKGKNIVIFFLIGVIIVLGGILVFSNIQNDSSNAPQNNSITQNISGPQPRITVVEEEWDFGKVIQGEKPSHIFTVKNEGEGDLIIDSLKGSCPCIEASISANLIKPGESAELKVSYDTTDYVGKDEKHVHIYSNDPRAADKRVNLFVETEKLIGPYLEK